MEFLVTPLAVTAQVTNSFTDGPQVWIVWVCFEASLIGERQHLVIDTRGVAYAQHIDAAVYEFLRYPVDSHITLCTYQYLTLAHQCFTDGLHQCGGLACSWGTMDDSNILGA